jgi:adenylate cyclase
MPATDPLLYREAWRNERMLNALRATMWLLAAAVTLTVDILLLGHITGASYLALTWGLTCASLGAFVLRRSYAPALPYIFVTFDLLIMGLMVYLLVPHLVELSDEPIQGQVRVIGSSVMIVMATNVLRLSRGIAIWTFVCGTGVYLAVRALYTGVEPDVPIEIVIFLGMTMLVLVTMTKTRVVVERIKERDTLARFLPQPVLERAISSGSLDLGGQEVDATVLFADIRAFTTLASERTPGEVVDMLNEYFAEMVDEIFAWRGVLDKFLGDGVCAVFTTIVDESEPARRAIACGAGMLARLDELNARRADRGEPPLEIGIGLHTGRVLAGTIGSPVRMEYTHIGDVVNTASRVQELTKRFGVPLLASADTVARAGGAEVVASRPLGPAEIRGRAEPVELYAIDAPLTRLQERDAVG